MSHNSLVSGPNLMFLESYESLRSLFSIEIHFIGSGPAILREIVCTSQMVKLDILDRLALEADLEGQIGPNHLKLVVLES